MMQSLSELAEIEAKNNQFQAGGIVSESEQIIPKKIK